MGLRCRCVGERGCVGEKKGADASVCKIGFPLKVTKNEVLLLAQATNLMCNPKKAEARVKPKRKNKISKADHATL